MAKSAKKKMYERELGKALREQTKKSKPQRQKSKEHELFELLDAQYKSDY